MADVMVETPMVEPVVETPTEDTPVSEETAMDEPVIEEPEVPEEPEVIVEVIRPGWASEKHLQNAINAKIADICKRADLPKANTLKIVNETHKEHKGIMYTIRCMIDGDENNHVDVRVFQGSKMPRFNIISATPVQKAEILNYASPKNL